MATSSSLRQVTNRNYWFFLSFLYAPLQHKCGRHSKSVFHNDHVSKQIQWQKKEKGRKKHQVGLQKKYLSADLCHKEFAASDPPLIQSRSQQRRFLRLLLISVKDTALSVENQIQRSHMFIAPATPFPFMINNQTCHPEQTKLEGGHSGLKTSQQYQEKQELCSHSELAGLTPPPLNHLGK